MSTQEILSRLKALQPSEDLHDITPATVHGQLDEADCAFIRAMCVAGPALVEALERIDGWCEAERHAPPDKQEHGGRLMPIGVIRTIMISALAPLKEQLS